MLASRDSDTLGFVVHQPAPIGLDPDACVTASGLVRRFGVWQERAAHTPVFILRRGRPSLVMTSVELMRRLCVSRTRDHDRTDRLLDAMREAVIAIDGQGLVRTRNRAARLAFPAANATCLSDLMPEPAARLLTDLAALSRQAESVEHAELTIGHGRFQVALVPQDEEMLLIASDITRDFLGEACTAELAAFSASMDMLGIATARVNLRGIITSASGALTVMTARASLAGIRFTAMFDLPSQAVLDRAIERALDDGAPQIVECALLSEEQPVRVCIAAVRVRDDIAGVSAVIVPQLR